MMTELTESKADLQPKHHHYEVDHREPLKAIILPLYTSKVFTGQERKSRISRSRNFSFAERSGHKSILLRNSCGLAKCTPT